MRTVLLVEPDERARAYCRRVLEAEGCRVLEAAGGPGAAGPPGGAAPDLVLCDLTAAGRADVAALRRAWPGARVLSFAGQDDDCPRLSLSGLSLLAVVARALQASWST